MMMKTKQKGFTLIELMIVVAIIGVIGAVAVPSYKSYMTKTGRADAKVGLAKVADKQERYYLQNNIYAADTAVLGLANPYVTDEGFYEITVTAASTAGFGLTAAPVTGRRQDGDVDCETMSLSSTGAKTATAGAGGDATKCW